MMAHLSEGGIGQRYAGISPIPFVTMSNIWPSGYFRIFSWWKLAVGTLPRWNRIPLPSPRASWHGWQ
jgi:hypothetical protein